MILLTKDPDAHLDYGFDWADWLDGDTISSSSWIIEGPDEVLTQDNPGHDDTTTSVWLAGGTLDEDYILTNRVTSAANRVDDRSYKVCIRAR